MRQLILALALLGILVLAMGCVKAPSAGTQDAVSKNISAEDIGGIDDPDSESLDIGIPLEDI